MGHIYFCLQDVSRGDLGHTEIFSEVNTSITVRIKTIVMRGKGKRESLVFPNLK